MLSLQCRRLEASTPFPPKSSASVGWGEGGTTKQLQAREVDSTPKLLGSGHIKDSTVAASLCCHFIHLRTTMAMSL